MYSSIKDVADSELAVLEQLWKFKEATIRQLADVLYPGGLTAHYATVQKLLERLEAKGYAKHTRDKIVNVYSAKVNREKFVGSQLRTMAEKLCSGSLTPVLTNLVKTEALTKDERQSLRKLLDDLETKKRRPKG